MSTQKSHKEYQGIKLSEAPLPKTIETCLWKHTGECQKSMPELYARCKGTCFAFIPYDKSKGDYQI